MEKYNEKALGRDKEKIYFGIALASSCLAILSIVLFACFAGEDLNKFAAWLTLCLSSSSIILSSAMTIVRYYRLRKLYLFVPEYLFLNRDQQKSAFAEYVAQILKDDSAPLIIYSKEEYGTGKTTFLRYIEDILKNKRKNIRKDKFTNCKVDKDQFRKIRKRINRVYAFDENDENIETIKSNLSPKQKNKFDFVLIDNVENIDLTFNTLKRPGLLCVLVSKRPLASIDNGKKYIAIESFNVEETGVYLNARKINTTDEQLQGIFNMTGGNPKKLTYNLSNEEIKNIIKEYAIDKFETDFDEKLHNIQKSLDIGNYVVAENALRLLYQEKIEFIKNNYCANYRYTLKLSDTYHLLNRYPEARQELSKLRKRSYECYDAENTVDINDAHYYKHMGEFGKAIALINKTDQKHKLISLYILAILKDLLVYNGVSVDTRIAQYSDQEIVSTDYYAALLNVFNALSSSKMEDKTLEYFNRYYDIFDWIRQYKISGYKNITFTTPYHAKDALAVTSQRDNRLQANDKFIITELSRVNAIHNLTGIPLQEALTKLIPEYMKVWEMSIGYHDYNLRSQVEAVLHFLNIQHNIQNSLNIDIAQVKRNCIEKHMYFNAAICSALLDIENRIITPATVMASSPQTATSTTVVSNVNDYFAELFDKMPFIIL